MKVWWKPKSCTGIVSNIVRAPCANAFPPIAFAKLGKCKRYFCGSGHVQRVAGSDTKPSFNASITPTSSDSLAALTIGNVRIF
ncbi:MAG: hypothetical protein ACRD8Z_02610 [Nitrososphaeraceae archaeon]